MRLPIEKLACTVGLLVNLTLCPAHGQESRSGANFGETPPQKGARIFAPGFASTEHHDDMFPVFSPDGREAILRINGKADGKMIAVLFWTRMTKSGDWTPPEPLPFLTRHMNGGASYSPDGSRIYFTTKRPLPGEDEADAHSRLWLADRNVDGWSDARPVDTPINEFNLNGGCFLSADGTLYASFIGLGKQDHDIYELREIDGGYPEFHPLPGNVNSSDRELAPFVDPFQGYLLFTTFANNEMRIKLSFRGSDGSWSTPEVVHELTEPEAKFVRVSPDGMNLFFVSHKKTDFSNPKSDWTIDEFDQPPMGQPADIYWMNARFLANRVGSFQVRRAVNDYYIKALETRDFSLMESICLPHAVLQGSRATGELRTTDLAKWSKRFTPGKLPLDSLTSDISKIDVEGRAAQVRIDFVINGKTPITDYLNLVRVEGRWRITNIVDH